MTRLYTRRTLSAARKIGALAQQAAAQLVTDPDDARSDVDYVEARHIVEAETAIAASVGFTDYLTPDTREVSELVVALRRYCDAMGIDYGEAVERADTIYGALVIEAATTREALR